ncbi:acetyl ornithine aminotransferase family protein [candidate division KSB1 bacterium]|nr:acetyl ornithine aminotransferase family protein [candidate division KSB1 bacterium]
MEWWQEPVPNLITVVPGPRSRQIIERDNATTSTSYTRDFPLVVDEARGLAIRDMDGNVFLDFAAGIAVCATGHCHPDVVEAIQAQAQKLIHICTADFYSEPVANLAEKLCAIAPGDSPKRVFFCNSGAEANEAAIKLARYATGRPNILAFLGGFHGRTMGAMSLTASKIRQREGFGPLMPGVIHVPYPNPYHPPFNVPADQLTDKILKYIEETVFKRMTSPEEVAAIFVEPIQGEGGYISPPDDFLPLLKSLAQSHGILLVVDEVQSGMGRTGRMFAVEHVGVEPDIITLSKGIASGMVLGAMVARSEIMTWKRGAHANTLGGNPVSCAASLATIKLLEEGLVQNASEMGQYLLSELKAMQATHSIIGDVRGRGLMLGAELIHPDSGKPNPQMRDEIVQHCFKKGLLILGCGESAIRFCPPLIVQKREVDIALSILEDAIQSGS